jgi:hypothetical protein
MQPWDKSVGNTARPEKMESYPILKKYRTVMLKIKTLLKKNVRKYNN